MLAVLIVLIGVEPILTKFSAELHLLNVEGSHKSLLLSSLKHKGYGSVLFFGGHGFVFRMCPFCLDFLVCFGCW